MAAELDRRHALFPGSFDPATLGHVDLVWRATRIFDRVVVALAEHPSKEPLFSIDERGELLRASLGGNERVSVARLTGLLVDGCRELGCGTVVRGVRSAADFDYEREMVQTNRALAPEIETVLLVPDPRYAHISSTLVRQIARHGGDVRPFVPVPVADALAARFGRS